MASFFKTIVPIFVLCLLTLTFLPLLVVHTRYANSAFDVTHFESAILTSSQNDGPLQNNETVGKKTIRQYNEDDISIHESWADGCHTPEKHNQDKNEPPTGLVVVLAMAPEDKGVRVDAQQRICRTIPTHIEYFLEPQGLDMLFLVEEKGGLGWDLKFFQECFGLVPAADNDEIKRTWRNLDGTILEATPFTYEASTRKQSTFFLGATTVNYPKYVQKNLSILWQPITPISCQATRTYIQATRWYTKELLHLGILQDYDYFFKIDTDIIFVDTIPFHILQDMAQKNAIFAHTAEYHPKGSKTCAMGIQTAVMNFTAAAKDRNRSDAWKMSMCSEDSPEVARDADLYYTNFIAGRVSFWQSPWILEFSNFLNEFEHGFFSYRWTDQIFWHMAMGLYLHNFVDYVADYTNLRCMPHPDCWLSSYNFRRFGQNAWHNCDNGGYFLHPKDFRIPNTLSKPPIQDSVWNASQALFHSTYKKDCSLKKN